MAIQILGRIKAAFGARHRADEKSYPKDETLRLVLSEEERDFISLTIRHQNIKTISGLSYIIIFVVAYYGFYDFFYPDYLEEYARKHAGLNHDEYYGGMSRSVRWGSTAIFFMMVATPIAAAVVLDGLHRLIKFSRYRKEHRAFLRKYDRERLYYGP